MKHTGIILVLGACLALPVMAKHDKDNKEHQSHKAKAEKSHSEKEHNDKAEKSHGEKEHHDKAQPAVVDGGLPPGLQKKVARGEPLPPGWQKKYHRGDILEQEIYQRGEVVVPIGRDGEVTIRIDDTLFRVHEKTRKILDILTH
ncbi:hypothetical protein [Shewanella sedimentimangrovi]|uniref:Periplasmic protein n=1 Tax=Shewanella sedimentimangrovi TaxID=2814293 RepID=A0ABX7R465_9GAMM|nr:hypothetical protein [Shewanella sedimentimangrovi]QSX38639.1 hypothetical protein JYB85_07450 [Shewanella sedimentimangrovi]